jgi:hypothetical protein
MAIQQITRTCEHCGISFLLKISGFKIRAGLGRFCQRRCANRSRGRGNDTERFWSKVGPPDANGCRPWLGTLTDRGYGEISIGPRGALHVKAHAYGWQITYHGPVKPDFAMGRGATYRHSCDIHYQPGCFDYRSCCEPSHVYPSTHDENMADMVERARQATGDRHGCHKLTEAIVRDLKRTRLLSGESVSSIARSLGVSRCAIRHIKAGRTWAWLD